MRIADVLYGTFDVTEPVLVELLHSTAVQRLKRLNPFGIPDAYHSRPNYFSKYEHALGVMLLLRRLGAEMLEQIAGLLHDISNLAFSHVSDWVFGDQLSEAYQDGLRAKHLQRLDVSRILERHVISPNVFIDLDNFRLLERPIPELCVDRFDYVLRELHYSHPDSFDISFYLDALGIYDGLLVFTSRAAAELFAHSFLQLQKNHWGTRDGRIRYHLLSQMLKEALRKGLISKDDFWSDDATVLTKLRSHQDAMAESTLKELSRKPLRQEIMERYASQTIHKKFRHVDPLVLDRGEPVRLSSVSPSFTTKLKEARKINERGGL